MPDDRAKSFLQLIRRSQRGRLKVYLGYGPGVGKTYQMLSEAHRLVREGIDAVVGVVETHGRPETERLVAGLEVVPRRRVDYHGITVEEMDLDAVLSRRPQVVLVDELAHTNVPGNRNAKRYEDVQEILAAGVHVITALNVQHLESLYDTVERLVGVKVRERLPDAVLAEADVVVNVDLAAEDLQQRLRDGKIYPRERVAASLENFFTGANLEQLRELTLRELAGQLDLRRREAQAPRGDADPGPEASAPDQVMLCLSSRGPNSARLLRFASRLAGRLNRNWYAVYVQTPDEDPTVIDAATQRVLGDTLTLANRLGATVFTFKGQDVADTILRFAKEYRVSQIVIGRPRRLPWWRRLLGQRGVAEELIHRARGVSVVVVDADARQEPPASSPPAVSEARQPGRPAVPAANGDPVGHLSDRRVLLLDEPVARDDLLRRLAAAVAADVPGLDAADVVARIAERERQGSTFLNEGVALPHARVPGLAEPQAALAVTRGGILDAPTGRPVDVVFLLLSPDDGAAGHLRALAKVGRLLQSKETRRRLARAATPAEVASALAAGSPPG
ncbi:MAG TPA: PTS sugar transporter subunit IIA [Humisphaera sp.]